MFVAVSLMAKAQDADDWNHFKNLARMNLKARIEYVSPLMRMEALVTSTKEDQNVIPLILDDNTVSFPLAKGKHTFVIDLPTATELNRFAFINENAAASGEFEVAVSNYRLPPNDGRWRTIESSRSFTGKRFINVSLAGLETKYIQLTVQAKTRGRIAALAVYGNLTVIDFSERYGKMVSATQSSNYMRVSNKPEERYNFNFANAYSLAKVIYASSGRIALAPRMIDDDAQTNFHFASSDPNPTVVVELSQNQRIYRVSACYKTEPGRMEVYLFNKLPDDLTKLSSYAAIASSEDHLGEGKTAVNFAPQNARYIVLRWTPDRLAHESFEISDIGAFGLVPPSAFDRPTENSIAQYSGLPIAPFIPIDPPTVVPTSP